MLASAFYLTVKALEYETVNPEADDPGDRGEFFDPSSMQETTVRSDVPNLPAMADGSEVPAGGIARLSTETGDTRIGKFKESF
jgi:hypothetical protein